MTIMLLFLLTEFILLCWLFEALKRLRRALRRIGRR